MKGYFEKTRLHLQDMTNDLKKSVEWKMYLIMKPKFMSSKDSNEKCGMYCKSDSSMVMISNDTDEIIQENFDSL